MCGRLRRECLENMARRWFIAGTAMKEQARSMKTMFLAQLDALANRLAGVY